MIKEVFKVPGNVRSVFSSLADFGKYQEWLPKVRKSKVVSTDERGSRVEFVIDISKLMSVYYTLEVVRVGDDALRCRKVEGPSNVRDVSVEWRLASATDGDGTVLIGTMDVDAGPFKPRRMVERECSKLMHLWAEAIRVRVASTVRLEDSQILPAPRRKILQIVQRKRALEIWFLGQRYTFRLQD